MMLRVLGGIIAGAACVALLGSPATAAPPPKHYSSCAAVHKDYSGGIAKPGVNTNALTKGGKKIHVALGGTVKHSTALYKRNRGLDRDHDGVACEIR